MASGGARARAGPAPDPNALRRDRDHAEWRTLPMDGRAGPPPPWPLSRQTRREATLWEREWRRPQAVVWEENGQAEEVAMYVRNLVAAEKPGAAVSCRSLVCRHMDALGISALGLRANRWRIGELKPAQKATGTTGRDRPAARARLGLVKGGSDS